MNSCPNKLEVKGISKTYMGQLILKDITFGVKQNEFVSIIGPSGCGKSTLFNIIAGLQPPLEGTVLIDGEPAVGVTRRVGYMHQKDLLLPWRSVRGNVIIPLELQGMRKKEAYAKADVLMPLFGLNGHEKKYPCQLSGGMRQRASLMRAYMLEREIMLLDEPFGGLDAMTKVKMQDYLLQVLVKMKRTILFITHDIDEAIFLSDRIIVLGHDPAEIIEIEKIDLPAPRHRDVVLSGEFLAVKKRLLELL